MCAHLFGMSVCYVFVFLCVLMCRSIINLKRIYTVFWEIGKTRIDFGTMVDTARAHLSQQIIVHVLGTFGAPGSVDLTDSSEHWATDDAYVKVNCETTSFITDVGWIARNIIVILFRSKNMNILFVKRSENKTTICLVRSLFHNQIVVDSSGVYLG